MKVKPYEIKQTDLETVEDMIQALMKVPKSYTLHPLGQKCAIAIDHYHQCVYLDDPNWIKGYQEEITEDIETYGDWEGEVPDETLQTYCDSELNQDSFPELS